MTKPTPNALSIQLRKLAGKWWMPPSAGALLKTAARESEEDWASIMQLAESKAEAVKRMVNAEAKVSDYEDFERELLEKVTELWDAPNLGGRDTERELILDFFESAVSALYSGHVFTSPFLPVPGGPKSLRETLTRACTAVGERELDKEKVEWDLKLLAILIDRLDDMRPLGVDGEHGNLHTDHCGCEDKSDYKPAPWHFTLHEDGTLTQHYKVPEVEVSDEEVLQEARLFRSAMAYAAGSFATIRRPRYPQVGDKVIIHKPSSQAGLGSFYSTRDDQDKP